MNGEEIYVTMVVLRRPTREGQPGLDPQQLAQALIQGLTEQGTGPLPQFPQRRTRFQADMRVRSSAPSSGPMRQTRTWILLGLSFMLLIGAAYALLQVF